MKEKNELYGALVGLAMTCATNPKTDNTDDVIIEGLHVAADEKADAGAFAAMTEKVREEKFAIVPGCRYCGSPCGNTSDYDLSLLGIYPVKVQELKKEILELLTDKVDVIQEDTMLLYKALAFVSYDMDEEALGGLVEELKQK